jgi:hypothetical protein
VVCGETDRPLVFPARSDRPWVICSVIRLPHGVLRRDRPALWCFRKRSDRPNDIRKIQPLSWSQTNGCFAPISLQGGVRVQNHAAMLCAACCPAKPDLLSVLPTRQTSPLEVLPMLLPSRQSSPPVVSLSLKYCILSLFVYSTDSINSVVAPYVILSNSSNPKYIWFLNVFTCFGRPNPFLI